MIVGLPTDDGVTVCEHFGRAKYFLIAKVENGSLIEKKLIENAHNKQKDEQVGHGMVLKTLTDNEVRKVICTNLGPRMLDNLGSLNIAVERCNFDSKIDDLLKGEVS